MALLLQLIKNNYRTVFAVSLLILVFYFSLAQNYLLFHTVVELFSIVVAFAVFIVTWNSRRMLDNNYLFLVGTSYIFIGALDLLHTLTFKGMHMMVSPAYHTNQFWVATRFLQAVTLLLGFRYLNRKKLNADAVFISYLIISVLIVLAILYWNIFPVCYIEGYGLTPFKIYAEYVIIAFLLVTGYLLIRRRNQFNAVVYRLLLFSVGFTILSEFCFTLYVNNYSTANELGHYFKLIAFFLIYKANVETGFVKPTDLIFKNLTDNEQKYRTLAENLPVLVMRFNEHLKCIYTNNGNNQLSSVQEPQAIENNLKEVLLSAKKTQFLQETNIQFELNGTTHFYAVQAIPEYHMQGGEQSYLVICQNVSALKKNEQELQDLNATKDKFFSIIAHDLRNPFTSLLSFSDLIYKNADKLKKEKIEQMALRIYESAKQAHTLLENLLNWSRVQTGVLKPNPQTVRAADVLEEAKQFANPLAQAKGIEVSIKQTTDECFFADRQMVSTILRNLVSNAIKFSYPDSSIWLTAEAKPGNITFTVADTGIGIEKENIEDMLKIDSKRSTLGTAAEKGTGLGLVLCREFVELNGGQIWLNSEFGMGTTFYFTMPLSV